MCIKQIKQGDVTIIFVIFRLNATYLENTRDFVLKSVNTIMLNIFLSLMILIIL